MESSSSTPVTIYGRTYHLRGSEDPAYLKKLAGLVDRQMREVAEATGTADTLKTAILAALNLADAMMKNGSVTQGPAMDPEWNKRLGALVARMDEVLSRPDTETGPQTATEG